MPPRPSRLERITNLVLALLETPRPLSLREIGTSVAGYPQAPGALRQAFERDKRTLRDGGIPIAVERIDGDEQTGYRILAEEYYLPELGLSEEELEALVFALAIVRLEGGVGSDVAAKLGASAPNALPPVAVLPSLPALAELHAAIKKETVVQFGYRGRGREVEGYGLIFREGSWYLVGNDRSVGEGGAIRSFRVDRIEGDVALRDGELYTIPPDVDVEGELHLAPFASAGRAIGEGDVDGSTEVTIALDRRELSHAVGLVGADGLVDTGQDTVELRFRIADEEAFCSWILGLGNAVEVLGPRALRSFVKDRLAAVATGKPGGAFSR